MNFHNSAARSIGTIVHLHVKFQHNQPLRCYALLLIRPIITARFSISGGQFCTFISQGLGSDLNQMCEEERSIIGDPNEPLDFRGVASFRNQSTLIRVGSKIEAQFRTLSPSEKSGGGGGRRNV